MANHGLSTGAMGRSSFDRRLGKYDCTVAGTMALKIRRMYLSKVTVWTG